MGTTQEKEKALSLVLTLLCDVSETHGVLFNTTSLANTTRVVRRRVDQEGIGFLTKTIPRLVKAFDRALTGECALNVTDLRFRKQNRSELPKFMGEFFNRVFSSDGWVLPDPCVHSVRIIRQMSCLYKYKLPYDAEQEQSVVAKFEKTEQQLEQTDRTLAEAGLLLASVEARCCHRGAGSTLGGNLDRQNLSGCSPWIPDLIWPVCDKHRLGRECVLEYWVRRPRGRSYPSIRRCYRSSLRDLTDPVVKQAVIISDARRLLKELFATFDPSDIHPKHGPGAVSTRERLWDKYLWKNISDRITEKYPIGEFFFSSLGHLCDELQSLSTITTLDHPARVCLVPKDSRGPRLISCEPVDFQWVQQGLGQAIRDLVERHPLTRYNVHFTDQQPNQFGALLGSWKGSYATLDLNEASDRVSLLLVRLLFPDTVLPYLEACRTSSTTLPNGRILPLRKFAPMGSNLCFPILALTIWAILTASIGTDRDSAERILVYGDDVIVPTAKAGDAIEVLESFGLKINRDKSCIKGFFRESCGVDAFRNADVTPLRFKEVWSSDPHPSVFTAWIDYSNQLWERGYIKTATLIGVWLEEVYGPIPSAELLPEEGSFPALRCNMPNTTSFRVRVNKNLQRFEMRVPVVKSVSLRHDIPGWSMLLRYFSEKTDSTTKRADSLPCSPLSKYWREDKWSASSYTKRDTTKMAREWRWITIGKGALEQRARVELC